MFRKILSLVKLGMLMPLALYAVAEPVAVRHAQGTLQGFLTIRLEGGKVIGSGTVTQVARGNTINARITYRFNDGSVDDESFVYSQAGTFRLLTDHHIQRGPFFPKPIDVTFDTRTGQVTTRTDGKVETQHLDLPDDLSNGLLPTLLLNMTAKTPGYKVGAMAPWGKVRLVKLAVQDAGTGRFAVAGMHKTATIFRLKIELGGVAGVVAPLIGKQPSDIDVWVLEGDAPALLRMVGQLAEGGPVVDVQLAGTSY